MNEHFNMFIKDNIALLRERIASAAARAGKDSSAITLVAVSKTKSAEAVLEAYNEGLTVFGENYAQELAAKKNSVLLAGLPDIKWHMIGHIQTNKISSVIGNACLIHSLDSMRLAEVIRARAEKASVTVDALLEINIAKEKNKYGFFIEEIYDAIQLISVMGNIKLLGFMTSAPFTDDPEDNRMYFRQINELYLDIRKKSIDNTNMHILSMGMSGDFEVAIEEGSTMPRIGTLIFGARDTGRHK